LKNLDRGLPAFGRRVGDMCRMVEEKKKRGEKNFNTAVYGDTELSAFM